MNKSEEEEPGVRFVSSEDESSSTDSHLVTKMNSAGDVTGLRMGRSADGRDASADHEGGRIIAHTAGPNPAKDARELRTGQSLVNHFNAQGARWNPARLAPGGKDEQGVDCTSESETGVGKLLIQVTTADRTETWRQLDQTQIATHPDWSVEDAAAALKTAIESKGNHPKQGIYLALDATDSIGSALPAVSEAFRAAYGSWVGSLGYEGVYLVGPEGLVTRLDGSG
ncbi:hypothetical protein [Embleya sp. NPDC059237]|uniref:hypothetical protein n=1 Tax=Embleya sp. NPDC059237 TaxID=3346784 RepID=UPI0036AAFB7C